MRNFPDFDLQDEARASLIFPYVFESSAARASPCPLPRLSAEAVKLGAKVQKNPECAKHSEEKFSKPYKTLRSIWDINLFQNLSQMLFRDILDINRQKSFINIRARIL